MSNGTPYVYNVTRRVRAALALIGHTPPRDAVQIALNFELPYCEQDRVLAQSHKDRARALWNEYFHPSEGALAIRAQRAGKIQAAREALSFGQEGKYRVYRMKYGRIGYRDNYSADIWVVARGSACALFSSWELAWHFLFPEKR